MVSCVAEGSNCWNVTLSNLVTVPLWMTNGALSRTKLDTFTPDTVSLLPRPETVGATPVVDRSWPEAETAVSKIRLPPGVPSSRFWKWELSGSSKCTTCGVVPLNTTVFVPEAANPWLLLDVWRELNSAVYGPAVDCVFGWPMENNTCPPPSNSYGPVTIN